MVSEAVDEAVATRICTTCFRRLPISEFRLRYRGQERRHSQCRECSTRETQAQRDARRYGQFHRNLSRVVRSRSDREVAAVVHGMARLAGGVDALVGRWQECVERALQEGKLHLALRGQRAFMMAWLAAERLKPPLDELPDDERAEIYRQEVIEIIKEQPKVVLMVAELLGWGVIPPPGVKADALDHLAEADLPRE